MYKVQTLSLEVCRKVKKIHTKTEPTTPFSFNSRCFNPNPITIWYTFEGNYSHNLSIALTTNAAT